MRSALIILAFCALCFAEEEWTPWERLDSGHKSISAWITTWKSGGIKIYLRPAVAAGGSAYMLQRTVGGLDVYTDATVAGEISGSLVLRQKVWKGEDKATAESQDVYLPFNGDVASLAIDGRSVVAFRRGGAGSFAVDFVVLP